MNRIGLTFAGLGLFIFGASMGWGATRLMGKNWEEAKQLYADACASCHGDNGKGQVSGLGVTAELAYTLCSVVLDLKISQLVNVPTTTVTGYLPEAIFD